MYHISGRNGNDLTLSGYDTHLRALSGLELAKYVLARLVDSQSIEELAREFDNDFRFIKGVIEFLKDIGWVKQDSTSSLYRMTEIGRIKANASKMIVWI